MYPEFSTHLDQKYPTMVPSKTWRFAVTVMGKAAQDDAHKGHQGLLRTHEVQVVKGGLPKMCAVSFPKAYFH